MGWVGGRYFPDLPGPKDPEDSFEGAPMPPDKGGDIPDFGSMFGGMLGKQEEEKPKGTLGIVGGGVGVFRYRKIGE